MSNLYYFEICRKKCILNIKVFSSIIVDKAQLSSHWNKTYYCNNISYVFLWLLLFDIYSPKYEYRIAYVLNLMHHFLQNCCKKLECLHVEKNQTTFLNVNKKCSIYLNSLPLLFGIFCLKLQIDF
jgi:hypothetical protein